MKSRVSKGRDNPGRDIPLSLCPGTRAGPKIPGQTPLSHILCVKTISSLFIWLGRNLKRFRFMGLNPGVSFLFGRSKEVRICGRLFNEDVRTFGPTLGILHYKRNSMWDESAELKGKVQAFMWA